jgi:transmembrane sensor
MNKDMGQDLLIRYVIGEANPEEVIEVNAWIEMDSENKKELERVKFIMDNSKQLAKLSPADPAEEWVKFKQLRSEKQHNKVVPIRSNTRWLQIAAAVLVICSAWIGYKLVTDEKGEALIFATQGVPQMKVLPDGSTRSVQLYGEAFFTVVHDQAHPFSVQTAGVMIKDVGTSFNVFNRGKDVIVIVENGIVEVVAKKTLARLSKGDELTVNRSGNRAEKIKITDHLHDYYRTGQFITDHTPLSRLIEVLNQAYNSHIVFEKEDIGLIPVSGNFKMSSVDENLKIIQMTTPELSIKKIDGKIVIGRH